MKNFFEYKKCIKELIDKIDVTIDGKPFSANNGLDELCKITRWCRKNKYPVFLNGDIDGTDNLCRIPHEQLMIMNVRCFLNNNLNEKFNTLDWFGEHGGLFIIVNADYENKELLKLADIAKRKGLYLVNITGIESKISEKSDLVFKINYDKRGPIMVMQFLLMQAWVDEMARKI